MDATMAKQQQRPELRFASLREMLEHAERLADGRYSQIGQWTLGQAASHIAQWMRFPIEGFPTPPIFMRTIFWVMRITGAAQRTANRILEEGFKPGMPTAPQTVADGSISDHQGIDELRRAVELMENHSGELHPSPLFGELDMAKHQKATLLHAAHHFSFIEPE